jgi:nucleoside-diphosphate-sugar epimerase
MPYTYVDNAVDCLPLAAISPDAIGQAYNVVDEPQVSVRDCILNNAGTMGERVLLAPVPSLLFSGLASLLELRSRLDGSELPPRLSRWVVRSACRDTGYDTRKAREQLGWQPSVTLEEGLRRTFAHKSILY